MSAIDSVEHIFFHVALQDTYHLQVKFQGLVYGIGSTETYGLSWATLVPGDANGDGKVDGSDLALWQSHYDPLGTGADLWTWGDWNGDNKIDGADLALWQQNYDPLGTGQGLALTDFQMQSMYGFSSANVPEPATVGLVALGFSAAMGFVRRKSFVRRR